MAPGRAGALNAYTVACQDRDFHEWHGGVSHALAWVLLLADQHVADLVAAGRQRLRGHLLPRYARQPHLTLDYVGLADAAAAERIGGDLEVIRSLVTGPVTLEATGWGSFPMVPYLRLQSPSLVAANAALTAAAPRHHRMDYVPHVTLGHYSGTWPLAEPLALLTDLAAAGSWEVGELSLVRFETQDIAGPLEVIGRLDLSTGRWFAEAAVTGAFG